MNQLIDGIVSFMKFAHISLNPDKCKMIVYDSTDQLNGEFMLSRC
jgi:hypothetical protein